VVQFLGFPGSQELGLSYRGKPGKGSNGLIIMTPVAGMHGSPAVTLISAHKRFIAGRGGITGGTSAVWRMLLTDHDM